MYTNESEMFLKDTQMDVIAKNNGVRLDAVESSLTSGNVIIMNLFQISYFNKAPAIQQDVS